ncbi:MAG TPA: carbohydrate kinase family protein [Myxococcales bacterium]
MFDVVTIGSATQDVFVKTDAARIFQTRGPESSSEYLGLPYGAKVNVSEVLFMTGGGATNAAVCLARQGVKAGIVTPVGKDDAGDHIRERLTEDQVDTSLMIQMAEHGTGYSVILTSFEGDRTVLVFRGASDHVEPRHLDLAGLCKTRWLYVSSLGASGAKVFSPLFAAARKAGVRIAFNPGGSTVEKGLAKAADLLEGLDVLLVNREEALAFQGRDITMRRAAPEAEDALYTELLKGFQAVGVKIPVITDSFRGSYALEGKDRVRCPAHPVDKVVSTLGAGDAFGSTFVAGLLRYGDDLPKALREASINAASVVSVFGAKRGLLDLVELQKRAAVPPTAETAPRVTQV